MTKIWKILNWIVLGLLILICILGTFYKHISFGLGLGDIFGYFILYVGTLIHLLLTLVARKKGKIWYIVLTILFFAFTVLISLNATIWRGSQYSWNGSIFYLPCPTEIQIENDNFNKKLLIEMCTGYYDTEFVGVWGGTQAFIKEGQIKIPKKLEMYIKRPITKVGIEPDYWNKFNENFNEIQEPHFDKDTLKVGSSYTFDGEIVAVKNHQPIIRVTIK